MKTCLDGRPILAAFTLRRAVVEELHELVAIDDDACRLFEAIGLGLELPPEHASFARDEQARWAASAAAGRVYVALLEGDPVGFAALDFIDGEPHLAQLSVRRAYMRRGVGTALMARAIEWSATQGALWLTTYDHVPWNGPYYQRFGFVAVDDAGCGTQLQGVLRSERRVLPAPWHRTAMVFRHHIS